MLPKPGSLSAICEGSGLSSQEKDAGENHSETAVEFVSKGISDCFMIFTNI